MKPTDNLQHRIVIVGGGFGGVQAALSLAKSRADVRIILISEKSYLEYFAALYRIAAGRSPMEACIPYADIFTGMDVEVVQDRVGHVNLGAKIVAGESGSEYRYDFLILAVGSEPAYFGIPGMQELAYKLTSSNEALKLKRHLHDVIEKAKTAGADEKVPLAHIVVIGAGATGVELSGELAVYVKKLCVSHGIPRSLVTIDLVDAMPRVLPLLPEDVSARVEKRLRRLGVNVFLNRSVLKEEVEQVYLKDMQMKSRTVVWTAGAKANALIASIDGLVTDKRGRAEVDEFLRAKGHGNVFVLGDSAATKYSGMAQTAVSDGEYAADVIARTIAGRDLVLRITKEPAYAVPVGPGWAAVLINGIRVYGKFGWLLRRAADLKVFLMLLPPLKALRAFSSGESFTEVCPVCAK